MYIRWEAQNVRFFVMLLTISGLGLAPLFHWGQCNMMKFSFLLCFTVEMLYKKKLSLINCLVTSVTVLQERHNKCLVLSCYLPAFKIMT
jgi:hypothetical protein